MKTQIISTILGFLIMQSWTIADEKSDSEKKAAVLGSYQLAWVDVKDEAHNYKIGEEPGVDEGFLRDQIMDRLDEMGVDNSLTDEPDVDLKVICRFKHGLRKPVITPGGGIKTEWINQCSLKIVDKKSDRILFERAYEWKKDKVDVADFMKQAFKEWKEQRKKGEAPKSKSHVDSKK
jgi:hypothetical protein